MEKEIKKEKTPELSPSFAKKFDFGKDENGKIKEAPLTEEKNEGLAGKDIKVPEKFKKLVDEIEKMSVIELNELVKLFEKKFGVSAVTVAVAGPSAENGAVAEEKTEFNIELKSAGDNKIGVIKAIKTVLNLGLAEAKTLTESAPIMLKEGVKKNEAESIKKAIEEAGAKVELK